MGLYTVFCPSCKQAHQWFSGNLDQRCTRCRWVPDSALHDRAENLQLRLDEVTRQEIKMRLKAARALTELAEGERKIKDLNGTLEKYRDELQSEVRKRVQLEREVDELMALAQTHTDFIELQATRLRNARNHIRRVRYHCDVPEKGDSGPALDP